MATIKLAKTMNVTDPDRARVALGVAGATAPKLHIHGAAFGLNKAAGYIVAVQPFTNAAGRPAWSIVGHAAAAAEEIDATAKAFRRQLAKADNPTPEPTPKSGPKLYYTPAAKAAHEERKRQEAEVAKAAEVARLDQIGLSYPIEGRAKPDWRALEGLLDSGQIVAANREQRVILHQIQQARASNNAHWRESPLAVALGRALEASLRA
jgi:hypothetical protein